LKPEQPASIYQEEDRQLTHIHYVLIGASWTAYLFVIFTALNFSDRVLFSATIGLERG